MSIVVYGTILTQDRVAVSGSVKITQKGVFVSENGIIVPKTILAALTAGYFSQNLDTPIDGTVLTMFELPTGHTYGINLATGAATDLAELITAEGSAVAASDLQTLLQLAEQFTDTTVTSGPYTLLETDRYIRASGTWNMNMLATAQRKVPRIVFNLGTGTITAVAAGSDTINGLASWPIYPGQAWAFVDAAAGRWDAF